MIKLKYSSQQVLALNTPVMQVFLNTLKEIDPRLVEHGERVAYIVSSMLKKSDSFSYEEMNKVFILALFHDIGAYKTEEIDNLFEFETTRIDDHSIYGYLFLKNFTPIGDISESILYHHIKSRYFNDNTISSNYEFFSNLIHLADRIDILLSQNKTDNITEKLVTYKPGVFSKDSVDLFIKANENDCIVKSIRDKSYKKAVSEICSNIKFTNSENIAFLRMLPFLIDFRSPFTVTHTAATVSITICLAELFDLSLEQKTELYYASLLHDMGKIVIPLEILESKNKLSDDEMKIMRTHVNSTEDIIRGIVNDKICNIAINHHEKLNGTGYPKGLHADELDLQDRILAVADIASALLGMRSYKSSFSPEKTISILNSMAENGEICPIVVNKLADNLDLVATTANASIKEIKDIYSEIYSSFYSLKHKFKNLT